MNIRRFLVICLVLLLSGGLITAKKRFEKKDYVDVSGKSWPYCVLYPENYEQNAAYPLIIFLHGSGERGEDNQKQLTNGAEVFLDSSFRKDHPCIVVFPQCPSDQYWVNVDRINWMFDNGKADLTTKVVDFVNELIEQRVADPDQVYGIGLSMGGMGILNIVQNYPDLFQSAIAICGATDLQSLKKANVKTPVWLIHGDSDPVVPTYFSREAYMILKDKNAKTRYTEYESTMHDSWNKAFNEPDFLSWLFED
ncbi:MAG: prolyl oligopeptidase family serine peptidase [Bacteroidales bacterium]